MLGGQVQATSGGVEAMLPHVQKGSLKLLAVGAPARLPVTPSVPTITEAGGSSDMLMSTSYTFHARAGTPPEVLERMNAALTKVLLQPEVQAWTAARGLQARPSTAAAVDARIQDDRLRIGRLVRERGIKAQ